MPRSPEKKQRPWVIERPKHYRQVDNSAFYNNWKWRKKRKQYIAAHPLCVTCECDGIVTAATVVDHIIPIREGGSKYDDSNLQSLCDVCHNRKSAKEAQKYRIKWDIG